MALKVSNDLKLEVANLMWPIGSVYTTITNTDPKTTLGGTWVKIGADRCLMSASSDSILNTTAESGLPNITGNIRPSWDGGANSNIMNGPSNGALYTSRNLNEAQDWWQYVNQNQNPSTRDHTVSFDASRSNAIYGRTSIVRPPVYYVYHWRRTA